MKNIQKNGNTGVANKTPTRQQLRSWINRQRTLDRPSPVYLDWLRQQFRIQATAEIINGHEKENSGSPNGSGVIQDNEVSVCSLDRT